MNVEEYLRPYKLLISQKVNPLHLQILGYATSLLAYAFLIVLSFFMSPVEILFGGNWLGEILWGIELIFAGIPELILIIVFRTTITKFGRGLWGKRFDTALMIGCIPLTWWRFGSVAAVIHFTGAILFHYGEKQPK